MRWLIPFGFATVAACATTSQPSSTTPTQTAQGDDVVCRDVTETGSLISHRQCETRSALKEQHDDAERWLEKPRPTLLPGMSNHPRPGYH